MQLVSGKLFPADVPSSDRQQCGQNTELSGNPNRNKRRKLDSKYYK